MGITDFIRERATEDRAYGRISQEYFQAILHILHTHQQWPVLLQQKPDSYQNIKTAADFNTVSYAIRHNLEWATRESYVARFGTEPPTDPIVLALARIWKTHANFLPEWT
jgi:hypothetical protein